MADITVTRNTLEARLATLRAEVEQVEAALGLLENEGAGELLKTLTTMWPQATDGSVKRPKTKMCPICGEGPFSNLGRHTAFKHDQ